MEPPRSDALDRRRALATAALVVGVAGGPAYIAIRLYEHLRGGAVDLAVLLAAPHAGYYPRAVTAGWFSVLVGVVAFAVLRRRPPPVADRLASVVGWASPPVAAGCALAAWLLS